MKGLEGWPTIHYSAISEPEPGGVLYLEFRTFLRELPRLLGDGHAGRPVAVIDLPGS